MTVTVYTKPSCVQCNATYRALDSKGIEYEVLDVSQDERALAHVKELGYLPNSLAQGLRRQRSRLVGLCLLHTSSAYLAALIDVFEEIAASRGYEIMQVLSRNDPLTEIHRVRALLTHRVGGLILVPSFEPHQTCQLVADAGVPLVVPQRTIEVGSPLVMTGSPGSLMPGVLVVGLIQDPVTER